jgi:hypothetical protein
VSYQDWILQKRREKKKKKNLLFEELAFFSGKLHAALWSLEVLHGDLRKKLLHFDFWSKTLSIFYRQTCSGSGFTKKP